jgi:DNA repair exonuclease SbcCD ATPase subunit
LREQLEPIKKQIEELEFKLKGPRGELAELKNQKDSLQKELEVYKVETLNAEIKAIQHKLGFGSITVSEEKKLIDRKQRLEEQKPKVEKFAAAQAKIKKIHDSNDKIFAQLKALNDTKKQLNDKIKVLSTKLGNFLENKKQNDPNIKNLELQKDNIYEEKKKCIKKKRELDDEYEDKVYAHREQQKLLKYIKEATEKITLLKKKEEREKKRREKEAKENAQEEQPEGEVQKVEEEPFAYEMYTCEWLANYFKNSIASKDNTQQVQSNVPVTSSNTKIDEDISKGLIKPISRKDDEFSIGLSTSAPAKKKQKGPKVSKREQKLESSNLLTLDIGIIKKIQDVKLSPPSMKSDIPSFIGLLEKTMNDFKAQASAQKETKPAQTTTQVTATPTPKVEEVKKTEDKKVEDVRLLF